MCVYCRKMTGFFFFISILLPRRVDLQWFLTETYCQVIDYPFNYVLFGQAYRKIKPCFETEIRKKKRKIHKKIYYTYISLNDIWKTCSNGPDQFENDQSINRGSFYYQLATVPY